MSKEATEPYDTSLQMFVEKPHELSKNHLTFTQWLVQHGRIETSLAKDVRDTPGLQAAQFDEIATLANTLLGEPAKEIIRIREESKPIKEHIVFGGDVMTQQHTQAPTQEQSEAFKQWLSDNGRT